MITSRSLLLIAIIIGLVGIVYNTTQLDDILRLTRQGPKQSEPFDSLIPSNSGTISDRLQQLFGNTTTLPSNGHVIDERFLVVGDFPKQQLNQVISNLMANKDPGTEYSAGANRPFDDPGTAQQSNVKSVRTLPVIALDETSTTNSNLQTIDKPEPTSNGWYVAGDQICKNFGTPDHPDIRCVNGTPKGSEKGANCYIKRDGSIHCARSPAFSISPLANPGAVSKEVLPACGWNQEKSEQTGIGPPLDVALDEIGLCLDVTHSAWTPCGPGPSPIGKEEERNRGIELLAPPAITAGGCGYPCFCMPLPSGNCRSNLWCVGPPGCTCCPGLACNVCCSGSAWLWDATSGWCACAYDKPIEPSAVATP